MRRGISRASISEARIIFVSWDGNLYVVTDAAKWEVDTERDASEFDSGYYGKLLGKAWKEVLSSLN
jgi:hypothetical protein